MSYILKEFVKGILLRGESSDITDNVEGSIFHNSSTNKLKTYIGSAVREIITSSQTQTLTNKTIDYNLNTILNLPGGGGGGVNLDLSNIISTNIPDGSNLLSVSSNFFGIGTQNKSTVTGEVRLASGMVLAGGIGNSGSIQIYSGIQQGTGSSGTINITSGTITAPGTGSSGGSVLRSGSCQVSGPGLTSGIVSILSGKSTSNISGQVTLSSGAIDNFQDGYDNSTNTSSTGIIQINSGIIRNTSNPSRTGQVSVLTGSSNSLAGTGFLVLQSGRIVAGGAGNSGVVTLTSGSAVESPNASSGNVFVNSGDAAGTGNTGQIIVRGGAASGSGNSGDCLVSSGSVVTGLSGQLFVQTGDSSGSGTTGNLNLYSGTSSSSGNTGSIYIASGNSVSGVTGSLYLLTGGTSSTRGDLIIDVKTMYASGGTSLLVSTALTNVAGVNIDLLSNGTVYQKDITATTNFQFINGISGKRFTLVVKNSTASSLTANFPTVKQKAGTIINSVTANSSSIFEFVNSNGDYYCISCINNMV